MKLCKFVLGVPTSVYNLACNGGFGHLPMVYLAGDSEIYWLSLHNWDGPALAAEACRLL